MTRRIAVLCIILLIMAIVVREWTVEEEAVPYRIAGVSMAATWLGPHREVICEACRWKFACDESQLPEDGQVVCPNCGSAKNDWRRGVSRLGDPIEIDRSAFLDRAPRRWEEIVFHDPDHPGETCLKRIVGQPGEQVAIDGGDVVIDGRRVPRTLQEIRSMAQPVYDSRYRPDRDKSDSTHDRRWRGQKADTSWQSLDDGFQIDAPDEFDWLEYHPLAKNARVASAGAPFTVNDSYAVNQTLSRVLHPVDDLMLTIRLSAAGSGTLSFRIPRQSREYLLTIDLSTGQGRLLLEGDVLETFAIEKARFSSTAKLELVWFDAIWIVALDGVELMRYEEATRAAVPSSLDADPKASPPRPVAIGSRRLAVIIDSVELARDIYYTPLPVGHRSQQAVLPRQLREDEFAVLGDNSPVSLDSRLWKPGTVDTKSLVGKPRRSR